MDTKVIFGLIAANLSNPSVGESSSKLLNQIWTVVLRFFNWFFSTPTPFIAILSLVVAFIAYQYQRREKRKAKACEIAEFYSQNMLPRIRFFSKLLESTEANSICAAFSNASEFTEDELKDFLTTKGQKPETFLPLLAESLNEIKIKNALAHCGNPEKALPYYEVIKDAIVSKNVEMQTDVISRFVFDILNDFEWIALSFRSRLAEEELVYQCLHQTFLRHMPDWYYFVSYKNYVNADRYYINITWLYNLWKARASTDKKRFDKALKGINRTHQV